MECTIINPANDLHHSIELVQTLSGWNNAALQANAGGLSFSATTTSTTEWTCTKPQPTPNNPDKVIVQQRSSETTTQGILTSQGRERNQFTGFNLQGYFGPPTTTTDGPAMGSCPANPSGFTYDGNAVTTPGQTTQICSGAMQFQNKKA